MQQFPPFPPNSPFPAGQRDSIGDGAPDFPGSSGGREQGKFRPSATPKLTQVAVVNDDGTQIGWAAVPALDELTIYLRAIAFAMAQGVGWSLDELLLASADE